MVKNIWRYAKPFSSHTGTLRTDGQTYRQTDRRTDLLYQYRASAYCVAECWRAIKCPFRIGLIDEIKCGLFLATNHKGLILFATFEYIKQSSRRLYNQSNQRTVYCPITEGSPVPFYSSNYLRSYLLINDADIEVSDTCVRNLRLSWVELSCLLYSLRTKRVGHETSCLC